VRERGFALLIVLWSMALLGLLGTRITAAGRTDAVEAEAVAARASLSAAADGAVSEAIMRVLTGEWPADGRTRDLGPVRVRVEDEAGRINVNVAPPGLLAALLLALGRPADQAVTLAAAITDWHTPTTRAEPNGAKAPAYRAAGLDYGPRNAPFQSIGELGLVLGMTPEILAALKPHVTVFTEGDVDRSIADPAVQEAIVRFGGNVVPVGLGLTATSRLVRISAVASGNGDSRFERVAVVRISVVADAEDPLVKVLAWGS
jgi:general secretion pathway protein K